MEFQVIGLMDTLMKGEPITENVRIEVEADSEGEAEERARWELYKTEVAVRGFRVTNVEKIFHEELGELGKLVLEELKRKWLKNNDHLADLGFSSNILSKPELIPPSQAGGGPIIRYIHPGKKGWEENPQLHFPKGITPLILKVIKNKEEARIAINLIFEKIKVRKEMEADGDHHSITYGEPMFCAYYIEVEEAFALAKNLQELWQLIDEELAKTPG